MGREEEPEPRSVSSSTLCRGKRYSLKSVKVYFDEKTIVRDLLEHPGSVVVIPLLDGGKVIMLRQFRIGPMKWVWELPAGTIEHGEDPKETAMRELIEETGYRAGKMDIVFKMYPTPGVSSEIMYIYIARNLEYVGTSHQEDEYIRVAVLELNDVYGMIERNEIDDGKTIAALLYYRFFVEGR